MTDRVNVEVTGDASTVATSMAEAEAAVREGTAGITESFEGMSATIEAALAPLIAFTAIFESFEFLKDAIDNTAEFGKQLEITGQKTGLAAEQLSALDYAADLSDVTIENLNIGLQRLSRSMEGAEKGTGPAAEAFKALGINVKDANGELRPLHDVLLDLAQRFSTMEDGAGKTALAMDLFGRSGANLIPLLDQGRDGITALEEKAKSLGVTMGEDGVETTGAYIDQLKEFHQVMGALERTLALKVLPTLTEFVSWLEKGAQHVGALWTYVKLLNPELILLGKIWGTITAADPSAALLKDPALIAALGLDKKSAAPTVPDKGAASQMEQWIEELNVRKQKGLDNKADLLQIELDFWKEKLAIAEQGSKEYIAIHTKIIGIEEQQKHASDEAIKKATEATDKLEREWSRTLEHVPDVFATAIKNMKGTAGSFRDFWREMWYDLVAISGKAIWDVVADHYAGELAKKGITKAAAADRILTEAAAAVRVVAVKTWEGIQWIGVEAAKAAAAAWSAMAGIPVIGPALGVAAAIATFAGVLALAHNFHSAMNGFDIPANMNPVTQLHAQEMVLPKEYADVIRGMAGGGGGGGGDTHHWHINAMDAASFESFAQRHGGIIYKAAFTGSNAGKKLPGTPGRGPG